MTTDDTVVDLHPELNIDDDATLWQSEEDRERLLDHELDDDDTTLVDTTIGLVETAARRQPFWRLAFG